MYTPPKRKRSSTMNEGHLEIIKTARKMNQAAVDMFEESAEQASGRKTADFFHALIENEKKHMETLEKIENKSPGQLKEIVADCEENTVFFEFEESDIADIAANSFERDALNQALEREQKTRDFYRSLENSRDSEDEKQLLQWLIKGKSQHCKTISYVVALVGMQMLNFSEKLDIPYLSLSETETDAALINLVPAEAARRYTIFPVSLENGVLTLASPNPMDFVAFDAVENMTGYSVKPIIANHEEIIQAIDREYGKIVGFEKNLEKLLQNEQTKEFERAEKEEAESLDLEAKKEEAAEAPIVSFVNLLIHQAIEKNASDLHIEPQERGVDVRVRIDGILHKLTPPTKSMLPAIISRIKVLAGLDISQRRLPQDGHFRVRHKNIDIRVSTVPTIEGEKAVLRLLDKSKLVRGLPELGFEPRQLRTFQEALNKPQGVVLVTGPTGSGKTTTLYSGLNYLLSIATNIITVEDPVEYKIPYQQAGINQIQTAPSIGLDFPAALRSILRQDPDIIMVGEIRDLETAQLTVRASLTGHLVLTTIHTNNAIATITRLEDMGIKPYMLGPCLNLIVAQRLVRRICDRCKEVYTEDPELLRKMNISPEITLVRGTGCKACINTGYAGRVAIYEMLPINKKTAAAITHHASEEELRRLAEEIGMTTLRASGIKKIEQGITTIQEILARTMEDD